MYVYRTNSGHGRGFRDSKVLRVCRTIIVRINYILRLYITISILFPYDSGFIARFKYLWPNKIKTMTQNFSPLKMFSSLFLSYFIKSRALPINENTLITSGMSAVNTSYLVVWIIYRYLRPPLTTKYKEKLCVMTHTIYGQRNVGVRYIIVWE